MGINESESLLQHELRTLILEKLNSLDVEVKSIQRDLRAAVTSREELDELKTKTIALDVAQRESVLRESKQKDSIMEEIKKNYVTLEQFAIVKAIAIGAASMILVAAFGALIATVIKK